MPLVDDKSHCKLRLPTKKLVGDLNLNVSLDRSEAEWRDLRLSFCHRGRSQEIEIAGAGKMDLL